MEAVRYKIDEMTSKHREVARQLALAVDPQEIAKEVGLSASTVKRLKTDPFVKEQVRFLQSARDQEVMNLHDEIHRIASKGLDVLEGLLEGSEDENLQARIGLALLDRAGYSPVRKVDVRSQNTHAVLSSDVFDFIKERAREITLVDISNE